MIRPSRRRSRRKKAWTGYFFAFLLGVFLTLGGYLFLTHQKVFPPDFISSKKPSIDKPGSRPARDADLPREKVHLGEQKRDPVPRMAIVIDDLGGEKRLSGELLDMDVSLTFSILPFTPYAKRIARRAHEKGREIILHLPMEPHDYPRANPGEGVLLYDMGEKRLLGQLDRDIRAVPFVSGVSNHMGSRLMEDPEKMRIILSEVKKQGLFFLDSRTTPQTAGFRIARSLGLRTAEKTLFLDHSQEEIDIKEKIGELIHISLSNGKAIGIGHPHPATIKSLKEMISRIEEEGIEIVPLSDLMD
jgi:polysaccharide deacetylase 2 family uncharacterized protein YibQ